MARKLSTIAVELVAVGLMAAIALGFGITSAGMASGYVDPLLHAGAQDEAVYGHAAARMVRTGHWMTPIFLDRFMLNKPPLLMWAGGSEHAFIRDQSAGVAFAGAGGGCAVLRADLLVAAAIAIDAAAAFWEWCFCWACRCSTPSAENL